MTFRLFSPAKFQRTITQGWTLYAVRIKQIERCTRQEAGRAANYLLLGTSIPPLLDMNSDNPLDYLRSLAALLAEYDTYQQLNNPDGSVGARGRMGAMFKSGMRGVKGRRSSSAAIESLSESVESAQLDSLPLPPVSSGNLPEFTYLQGLGAECRSRAGRHHSPRGPF